MQPHEDYRRAAASIPEAFRQRMPLGLRRLLSRLYWLTYDLRDFIAESIGWIPLHFIRLWFYRRFLRIDIGRHTSIHRGCRFYRPSGVRIGRHTVINRDVLLDGRSGLEIGDNTSISEGTWVVTLEHDPNSPVFEERGAPVHIGDRVFIGARATILPGVSLAHGAFVGAGAVVTRDVPPFAIVAGVPAHIIGERRHDLDYVLDYRKFLG